MEFVLLINECWGGGLAGIFVNEVYSNRIETKRIIFVIETGSQGVCSGAALQSTFLWIAL